MMSGHDKAMLDLRRDAATVIILNDFGSINGGQSKIAIESALALRARGLDICFVAGVGPLDERMVDAGIECRVVGDFDILSNPNRFRAARTGLWNREAQVVLQQVLASRDPAATVIHVHGWAKALSPSIGPVVTRAPAAHVYTLHEYFLACPNGGFYDYQAQEICRRRALGADCLTTNCDPRALGHKAWRVARQAILWSAGKMPSALRELIYLAPEQREILGRYMPEGARWHYLPNPVGPRPSQRIRAEANRALLFVGRLSPEKGGVIAARAAREAGMPIMFVGDGEERDAILKANPDAIMVGWVSPQRVEELMREARALIFPSLWYETFGLVVADAIRAGLPVLVSRDTVAASLVDNCRSGEHVPAGDARLWGETMRKLADDELVRRYSEHAFAAGSQFPDEAQCTSALLDIYAAALTRKHQIAAVAA